MKDTMSTFRSTLPAVLFAGFLGGCASLENFSCDIHEKQTRGVKPVTTYALTELKPGDSTIRALAPGSTVQVLTYKIRFKPGFTKPCTTLTQYKDVVILRSDETNIVLNEIREFYAEDGALITSSAQDISEQVRKSGTYVASTALPIPKSAPPGKYKIVSKLLFERRGDRRPAVQVARAEGFFYIIPPQ